MTKSLFGKWHGSDAVGFAAISRREEVPVARGYVTDEQQRNCGKDPAPSGFSL